MTEADRPAVDRIRARLAQQPSWIIAIVDVLTDPGVRTLFKARVALDLGVEPPDPWSRRPPSHDPGRPVTYTEHNGEQG